MNTKSVPCCICECSSNSIIKHIDYKGNKLDLVRCNHCGLIYFSPRLKREYLESLYAKDNFDQLTINNDYEEEDRVEFSNRIELIEKLPYDKYNKEINTILDVGCSTGTFMKICVLYGYKVEGVDLNKKTNEYCRSLGFKVYEKIPDKKYDFIHLSDLIEHVDNPYQYMKNIRKHLNKEGIVLITTPNIKNPLNYIVNIKPDQHLYYFSKKTIKYLLEMNDFEVLLIKRSNRFHPIRKLVNTSSADKIRGLIKIFLFFKLDFIFDNLILKNLYTDLIIVAKKKHKLTMQEWKDKCWEKQVYGDDELYV